MKTITAALAFVAAFLFSPPAEAQSMSGSWTKKSHEIAGTWSIEGNTLKLVGLKTKKAPDLKLFLSPSALGELQNGNATDGAVLVAALKSSNGDQSYVIPEGTDLSEFRSLIIHCQKFSKLWGGSSL